VDNSFKSVCVLYSGVARHGPSRARPRL